MIEYKVWDKFGNWIYMWQRHWQWLLCKCICWKIKEKRISDLISWKSKWCIDCRYNRMVRHWDSKTYFYKRRDAILRRCHNSNRPNYKNYWWRWIHVCKEWHNYINFKNDMYESFLEHVKQYWEHNTTIERIDINKWYSKDNCIWITNEEQHNNRRDNHFEYINWKKYTITQLSREYNIPTSTIINRLNKWLTIEQSLNIKNKDEDAKRTMYNEETWSNETSSNSNTSWETKS